MARSWVDYVVYTGTYMAIRGTDLLAHRREHAHLNAFAFKKRKIYSRFGSCIDLHRSRLLGEGTFDENRRGAIYREICNILEHALIVGISPLWTVECDFLAP